MAEEEVVVVLCAFPDLPVARQIGTVLVEKQLAACVNLVPGVESLFRWKGALCTEAEVLGLLKTTQGGFEALREELVTLHPYEVPEVLALPVQAGHEDYLGWLRAAIRG